MVSFKVVVIWCVLVALLALGRVHFRVVTIQVAYNLGRLKVEESFLLERKASLQAELASNLSKKQLETLSK